MDEIHIPYYHYAQACVYKHRKTLFYLFGYTKTMNNLLSKA